MTADATRKMRLPGSYGLLAAVPIALFLLAEALLAMFGHWPLSGASPALRDEASRIMPEAAARLQFLATLLLFLVSSLIATAKFALDLASLFDTAAQWRLGLVCLVLLLAGTSVVAAAYSPLANWHLVARTFEIFGESQFMASLDAAQSLTSERWWGRATFGRLVGLANLLSVLAISSCIAGGISCLGRSGEHLTKREWKAQSARLNTYLYMSAWLLVVGILFMRTWTQYPAYLLTDPKEWQSLATAYAMFNGVEFALLLAGYAVPVAFFLSGEADRIARNIARSEVEKGVAPKGLALEEQVRTVREREKLTVTTMDVVKAVAALLAPLIAGSLPSLTAAG